MFGIAKKVHFTAYPGVDPTKSPGVNIVGESHYQENLAEAAQYAKQSDQYAWVALQAEPKNQYDKNANRVSWVKPDGSGWLTCGYIPRTDTSNWHPIIASAPKGTVWVWPAEVTGGDDGRYFGLYFYG